MSAKDKVLEYVQRAKNDTDGIPEDMVDVYSNLLDNEAVELTRVCEQTTTANIDRITTVFLPAIKKLARDSIINKIVGVQPIPDRVAIVQFMDYVYNTTAAGATAGDSGIDGPVTTEYSLDPGEGKPISRGLDFVIREEGVKARQRKLAGRWTFEAGDSSSKLGVNLEQEVTKALASKIVEEINFEVITDLYGGASGSTASWTVPLAGDTPDVKDRKEKELYYHVVDVASEIYDKTKRYPNFILCNPKTAAFFKRSGDYVAAGSQMPNTIKKLFLAGSLNDEFMIYTVPNLSTNDILVGYKGNSELESGAIYAPYIPLVVMDSFYNVENWTWIRSIGSFYAKSYPMLDLYGKVTVALS